MPIPEISKFYQGVIIGLFLGAIMGVFLTCLAVIAKQTDEEAQLHRRGGARWWGGPPV